MAKQTRQRTAAQRQVKEPTNSQDSRPLSDEEQDAEIASIIQKNESDKNRAQNMLDGLVLISIIITGMQVIRFLEEPESYRFLPIPFLQAALLPLSLTPYWYPLPPLRDILSKRHSLILGAQLALFTVSLIYVRRKGITSIGEIVRWALPELVAGAVEVQRRSERDSQLKITQLQGLKYDHKSA